MAHALSARLQAYRRLMLIAFDSIDGVVRCALTVS
jgi:hypothetical protein